MWVTAITGDIGAGKSTVAALFEELGGERIDADAIVKELWRRADVIDAAVSRWGRRILRADGGVDMAEVARIIFASPEENRFACELLHPLTERELEERARAASSWVIAEIPMLFERGVPSWVNRTIFVTAPRELRVERCAERGWDEAEMARRESFFLPSDERIRRSDFLIRNDCSLPELRKKLLKLAKMFKERSTGTIDTCLEPKMLNMLRVVARHAEKMHRRAYLVGGAVRDILLNRPTSDIDVAIDGNAISLLHRMYKDECRPDKWEMNFYKRYGSGTLVHKTTGLRVDLVSTRDETFPTRGARPTMTPADIMTDLGRRDYSVNAMAISILKSDWGRIIDPFGGRDDIKSRTLRVLHDMSFYDDPTRILRGIRFEQRLGLTFEPHTLELIKAAAEGDYLSYCVPARFRKEWDNCQAENIDAITRRMDELGLKLPAFEE